MSQSGPHRTASRTGLDLGPLPEELPEDKGTLADRGCKLAAGCTGAVGGLVSK